MAIVGFTSTVSVNDGASQAHVTIPEVHEVTMAGRETGSVECTPLHQTAGTVTVYEKQFIPTRLINPGMVKLKVYYTSSVWNRFNALVGVDYISGSTKTAFRFTAPDSDGAGSATAQVFTVNGFVTKLGEVTASREGIMEFEVDIQVSGSWTITGG